MSGHRAQRVADLVRRELAGLVSGELRDPRVGFVTVTDVRVSGDLRHAQVYVTLGEDRPAEQVLSALERASPFLRRSLAARATLRFTPELHFHLDEALESGQRVDRILRDLDLPEEETPSGEDD